jgi:predicted esterase
MRRLGIKHVADRQDAANEKFRIVVPGAYSTNGTWGLLVWVSPGDDPRLPAAWENELAERRLLLVGIYRAGNERDAIERCRLALDATCNMCQRYRIDPQRIYVAGFSGGGRIASILGVAYADVFTGCLAVCGVDFYQNVAAGAGQFYPGTYRPDARVALRARDRSRFVLLTGEEDPNRANTKATAENGFQLSGFKHVRYMEVSGMKHALPAAPVFATALDWLEGRQPPRKKPEN